ncbi:hypothetical protein GCM10010195_03480 [Kitasatospora griseola]|nr:hypothetical protein GCM10010195_03480 [Kitasatospora griseola]
MARREVTHRLLAGIVLSLPRIVASSRHAVCHVVGHAPVRCAASHPLRTLPSSGRLLRFVISFLSRPSRGRTLSRRSSRRIGPSTRVRTGTALPASGLPTHRTPEPLA